MRTNWLHGPRVTLRSWRFRLAASGNDTAGQGDCSSCPIGHVEKRQRAAKQGDGAGKRQLRPNAPATRKRTMLWVDPFLTPFQSFPTIIC